MPSITNRNYLNIFLLTFLGPFFFKGEARGHDLSQYPFKVDLNVLKSLPYDLNAQGFVDKNIPRSLQANQPITLDNISTATAQCLLFGRYQMKNTDFELELAARVDSGVLKVVHSLGQVENLVGLWEKQYASPPLFKKMSPHVAKAEFHDDKGFIITYQLKGEFVYSFIAEIPYDAGTNEVSDKSADFKKVKKFIRSLERDKRSRVILANNKSGLPPFIYFSQDGLVKIRHPWHDISWDPKTKKLTYQYSDRLDDVKDLPEIKRLMQDSQISGFIQKEGDVKVTMMGVHKNFNAEITGVQSGNKKKAKLEKNKLTVEN